jgi:hypothetical protein
MHTVRKLRSGAKPHITGASIATIQTMLLTAAVASGLAGQARGQGTDLVGWGWNANGQINTPSSVTSVTQIACGYQHSYALNNDGTLVGWGDNGYGQTETPANLAGVTQVACGVIHTYALKNDGTLVGWGYNYYGQINTPADLAGVTQVACGAGHNYALRNNGSLVGWGWNVYGQTNTPNNLADVMQVACGRYHTYALKKSGTLVGWGINSYGQTSTPPSLTGVAQVACGSGHTYALKNDGTLVGWGANGSSQISTPANLTGIILVACGNSHTYALKSNGTLFGWGDNGYGQTNTPALATGVTQIACGTYHTYALRPWRDCNANGTFDGDEIAAGITIDLDHNGVPDTCQGAVLYRIDSGDLGAPNPVKPAVLSLTDPPLTDTDVPLLINATGDFDASNEYLTVRLADSSNPLGYITLGRLFEAGGRNCLAGNNAATLTVPKDTFNRLAASGQLTIILVPSPPVTLGECPNGSMNVSLSYFGIGPDGDCDHDGRLDVRQIGEDQSIDSNLNSRIDGCEYAKGDFDLNGEVDTADLSLALLYLGEIDSPFGDLDGDGTVTTADVSLLLMNFGPVVWP